MTRLLRSLVLVLAACAVAPACAAAEKAALPAALRDWVDWVRHGHEESACPLLLGNEADASGEARVCAWPGQLAIAAGDQGAHFTQRWTVYASGAVPLPGDADNWPQAVRVGAQAAPVVPDEQGKPVLWLEPGAWQIEGTISWARRPESVQVPEQTALVQLSVDGKPVFPLSRDGETLWLGAAESAPKEANNLSVRVFRRLRDGVPAELDTRIQVEISGEGREETLGQPLPEGFVPIALSGDLNARLDPDAGLVVQVRPGSYALVLRARALAPLASLARPESKEPWPAQEIWSFQGDQRLRLALPQGAKPIDPAQAGVPSEWAGLPAFLMEAGDKLGLDERSRGLAAQDQNRLTLARTLWLDFDGEGYRARDQVRGRLVRDWRLDMAAPYKLTRAEEGGEGLLVTAGARPGLTGVELRKPALALDASARVAREGASLPVSGWQQSFDSIETDLHLPPGYRLYAAPGADRADGAWLDQWNLLAVFVVAVAALLAAWLGGRMLGALALGFLVLGFQERGAPVAVLLLGIVLCLLAKLIAGAGMLTRVLHIARNLALAGLVLLALPFVAEQLRLALYPQLEQYSPEQYYAAGGEQNQLTMAQEAPRKVEMELPPPAAPAPAQRADKLESIEVTGSRIKHADAETAQPVFTLERAKIARQRYASNTLIQAGSGEPSWRWGDYHLSWSGPVLASQQVRLVVSPPWLTRLTRVVLVALLGVLLARILGLAFGLRRLGGGATAAALALALVALVPAPSARAEGTPSKELLDELGQRVLEAPKCAPSCGHLAWAEVAAQGDELRVGLEFHAAEQVGVPLPGDEKVLAVRELRLDGAADSPVHRDEQGSAWIVLGRGVHRVDIVYRVAAADQVGLAFPLKPSRLRVSARDWEANGVSDERLLTDTLELTRVARREQGAAAGVAQQFPPFVRVVREISLELDWSVSSRAERIAPEQAAFSVRVPLLPGERVLTSDLKVEKGELTLPLQAGAQQAPWESQLERRDTLVLEAPPLAHHAEVWRVVAGPMWNVVATGVPAVMPEALGEDWVYEFHPLPGEKLTLQIRRPESVAGGTLAIDGVSLSSEFGKRAATHTLALSLRSTQGGQHAIQLPKDAEVLDVTVDGAALNLRPQDGKLNLPVHPGSQQVQVRFREGEGVETVARAPAVDLGAEASNVRMVLALPDDRWVLGSSGPRVGPAVLYWGELLVMALVAFALSRTGRTPLRFHHWLLLGLGFSTFSWIALLIVVAWLFALDARGRATAVLPAGWFNLRQVVLLLFTLAAGLTLFASIGQGLLGTPDMHVAGNGSTPNAMRWFQDRVASALPDASVLSVPMWVYKAAMLAWALWLATALVRWLRWGFACYAHGGYWRTEPKAAPAPLAPASDAPPAPDAPPPAP